MPVETTPNVETIHRAFRGASELAKTEHRWATLLDLLAAAGAIWFIFNAGGQGSRWWPLVLLAFATASAALRIHGGRIRSYAERCRRVSLRAFASAMEIDSFTASELTIAAPSATERFAKRLPAQSCHEYYEPTLPVGDARLTELYAHSAFYSHRLLYTLGFVAAGAAAFIFVGTLVLLYVLAVEVPGQQLRLSLLEALCSVLLIVLGLRFAKTTVDAFFSASSTKKLEVSLLGKPQREPLNELLEEYDIERVASPQIPTWLYRMSRNRLGRQWEERRKALTG